MSCFSGLRRRWVCWKWGREQCRLRQRLLERDDFDWTLLEGEPGRRPLRLVGGMDISFFEGESDNRAIAMFVVIELDTVNSDSQVVWEDHEFVYMDQPYIPGFLAFREVPHLSALLARLRAQRPELFPDVIIVDGNGVLHPRGFGCASHLGVVSDVVVVGMGKNLHCIDGLERGVLKEQMVGVEQGGHTLLVGKSGRTWGAALLPLPKRPVAPKRLQQQPKNPVFVSVGHRISLQSAVQVVALCCLSSRVPEPVRLADINSRELVRKAKADPKFMLAPPRRCCCWPFSVSGARR